MNASPPHPLHMVSGLALWGLWFVAIYGGLSYACTWVDAPEATSPFSWINILLGIFTLATITGLLLLARYCWHHKATHRLGQLIRWIATATYSAGAIATAAIGLPLTVLPPCV